MAITFRVDREKHYFVSVPDAENKESLSKNGITHILSVYNNAKPVFEVSRPYWTISVFVLSTEMSTAYAIMFPVSLLEAVMSYV